MAFARVNSSEVFAAGNTNSIASPATSLTAGNLIIASLRFTTGAVTVSGVTDTAGNTYTRIRTQNFNTTTMEMWYAENTAANGANVVTAALSGNTTNRGMLTVQYSGAHLTDSLRLDWVGTASGANAITAPFTCTLNEEDLLVMAAQQNDTADSWTAGTNLTEVLEDASTVQVMNEAIHASFTAITPSTSSTSTQPKIAIVAMFGGPSSGVGGSGDGPARMVNGGLLQ